MSQIKLSQTALESAQPQAQAVELQDTVNYREPDSLSMIRIAP
ncbi:hypothetical protein ACFIQF_10095 [Comamonas sp. J-3]